MSDIPASLKLKIQKLLELATNNDNEHEASSAAERVQALLGKYNLEMSQVIEGDEYSNPDAEREKVDNVVETFFEWQIKLFRKIADNNFCMRICSDWLSSDKQVFSL